MREMALLKGLNHRNVVKLLDIFGDPFSTIMSNKIVLIFEFLDSDLKKFMKLHSNCLGSELIWKLSIQLVHGIEYCHANYTLHRDLKPQNLLIDHRQKELRLKLADFGLAREYHALAKKYTQEA